MAKKPRPGTVAKRLASFAAGVLMLEERVIDPVRFVHRCRQVAAEDRAKLSRCQPHRAGMAIAHARAAVTDASAGSDNQCADTARYRKISVSSAA
jgi:hypothetical protein